MNVVPSLTQAQLSRLQFEILPKERGTLFLYLLFVWSIKKCHRLTLSLQCHHPPDRCPMILRSALSLPLSSTFNMLTLPLQQLPEDQTHPVTQQQPWRKTHTETCATGVFIMSCARSKSQGTHWDTIALLSMFLKELR